MIITTARLFDGKVAKPQTVTLELTSRSLVVKNDAGAQLGSWEIDELRDENASLLTDEIRLSVGAEDQSRFIIDDAALIAELRSLCPKLRKRRANAIGWWKPYVFWGGGAVVSVLLILFFVLPFLASQIAFIIPEEMEKTAGAKAKEFFIEAIAKREKKTPEDIVCTSEPGQESLDALIASLRGANTDDIPFTDITVLNTKEVNAFALPGGHIVVFSGLLDLVDDPNGISGVLAHELAHSQHRHPMQLLVSNAGMASVLSLVLGDVTGGTFLLALGQSAIGSSYSRDIEREADETGINMMQSAGYDLAPMILLMEELRKKDSEQLAILTLLDTHPGHDERRERLEAASGVGGAAMSKDDWDAVKNICN